MYFRKIPSKYNYFYCLVCEKKYKKEKINFKKDKNKNRFFPRCPKNHVCVYPNSKLLEKHGWGLF